MLVFNSRLWNIFKVFHFPPLDCWPICHMLRTKFINICSGDKYVLLLDNCHDINPIIINVLIVWVTVAGCCLYLLSNSFMISNCFGDCYYESSVYLMYLSTHHHNHSLSFNLSVVNELLQGSHELINTTNTLNQHQSFTDIHLLKYYFRPWVDAAPTPRTWRGPCCCRRPWSRPEPRRRTLPRWAHSISFLT